MGIARVSTKKIMDELKIDVPNAEVLFREIIDDFIKSGVLNETFLK